MPKSMVIDAGMSNGSLHINLRRLISSKKLSMRGLSIAAGLSKGAVEAILCNPKGDALVSTVTALAGELGVTTAQLIGEEELVLDADGENISEAA